MIPSAIALPPAIVADHSASCPFIDSGFSIPGWHTRISVIETTDESYAKHVTTSSPERAFVPVTRKTVAGVFFYR